MDNTLCFVQFMHQGDEHSPDYGCLKCWNSGEHKRKFMVSRGRYVWRGSKRATADRWEEKSGELAFWGEWEPQSEVICRIARPKPHNPRYVYRPFYVMPRSYRSLQNTDPFVFGGFFYGNCLQHREGRPTQLCCLENGSVILFGSCLSSKFVLDTLFVVRDSISYDCASYRSKLKRCVPRAYMDVALNPLCQSGCGHGEGCSLDKCESYRLYRGVTYKDRRRFGGMFSFFPSMRRGERCEGFKRPVINLRGLINGSLRQGFRLNRQADRAKVARLWQSVVDKVLGDGLCLGIEAQMPGHRRRDR
jgi:hypothetical protein